MTGVSAPSPRRGEVWWVLLDPTLGSEIRKTRPCLVMTNDILNQRRRTVVVVPFSTALVGNPPLQVTVVCAGRRAVAVTDQIRSVSKLRLRQRIGTVTAEDLKTVEDGLRQILELDSH